MSKTGPKTSPPTPLTGRSTPSRRSLRAGAVRRAAGRLTGDWRFAVDRGDRHLTETTRQIQGAGGKGSGGGGNTHVPTESRDTLRSKQIAHVIDLVSEGEIEGFSGDALQRIYLDDTPIRNPDGSLNLSDITLQYRSGTPLQEPVSGYGFDTAYEAPVAVELKYDKPVVRTLGNENTTALRVTLSVPQLTYQNPETGDLSGSSVEFRI